ncbi:hypothetical protein YTCETSXE_CDS0074 [Staphylococcus phage MVC_VPHSA2]|uniref:Phage protein n=1 Tax=Staphylococcus phage MVC_VPHSA1 TaxID=3088876 RepID=A0ABZ0QZS4_9CAUD|nr:hypothetical protein FBHYGVHD_CDS0053 [Staphylococcus phage MVC_VPHSA1]WPF65030.1 hypothetical protein YTCETSXE_CDS0074 [Staphylococcus phage MVC_VPHSA2]
MKLVYVHMRDCDAPVKLEVSDHEAGVIALRLESAQYDFVKVGSLVLPKCDIQKVKFTEVGK